MTRKRDRLTNLQFFVLMLMDDGPDEDSVGMQLEDFSDAELAVAARLRDMGLVETQFGWRFSLWFRLSVKGRNLLRTGVR